MNTLSKFRLFLALFSITYGVAEARIFRIRVLDYGVGTTPGEQAFRNYIDDELEKIENQINNKLPSSSPETIMEGMANSSVFAGKGIGADYTSDIQVILLGAGVGVGADLTKDSNTKSEISGAAVAPGFVVGTNLKWMDAVRFMGMDTNRLNVFFNFMNYNYKHQINDKPGKRSHAEIDMRTLGVHFRYDWLKGAGNKMLGWGGLRFHFGYEYNRNHLLFEKEINKDADDFGSTPGGEVITGSVSGKPRGTINTTTHSIPVELSTDIQVLYFLTLYGGLGADYNWGQSEGNGNLNGNNSDINCTGGACGGGGTTVVVKPQADLDVSGKPDSFTTRGFAGIQFSLPYTRIYVQGDKGFGNNLVSVSSGIRFVY